MKTPVTLTYFSRSGVAFAYDYFETDRSTMETLIFEVNVMRDDHLLPHLSGHADDAYIMITAEADWAYPHLILPPFLKSAVRDHWARTVTRLP